MNSRLQRKEIEDFKQKYRSLDALHKRAMRPQLDEFYVELAYKLAKSKRRNK